MRFLKYLLPFMVIMGSASAEVGFGADKGQDNSRFDEELNERDWEALREFVNTKRTIDVKEKGKNLKISGDVRTEWRHINESLNGHRLRGSGRNTLGSRGARPDDIAQFIQEFIESPALIKEYGAPLPISTNDFDVEFNIYFDYTGERAWGIAHVAFDNSAGVDSEEDQPNIDPEGWFGSGRCNDVCLKKAYFGYNLFCCDATRVDVEVGRRKLYHVFDSKVQFLSRFDGILFKYKTNLECINEMYVHLAGFVVDERVNQFAWATEWGFKNIADTGFDLKYSFIDWEKYGHNRTYLYDPALLKFVQPISHPKAFQFMVSQWTVVYHWQPEMLVVPAKLYGAFLMNHGRKRLQQNIFVNGVNVGKKIRCNLAWYAGVTFGEVINEGDWAFDFQYQVVQALAVPDNDVSGISNGNVLDNSITGPFQRGNTNYSGVRAQFLYALTDNLTIDTEFEWSKEYDKRIGTYRYPGTSGSGRHRYSKFELEAIYAF